MRWPLRRRRGRWCLTRARLSRLQVLGALLGAASLSLLAACAAHRAPTAAPGGGEARTVDPVTGMELVRVAGGILARGEGYWGSAEAKGREVSAVTVSDFYLGRTEVTQAQWEKVMGGNPSRFKGPDRPVEQVSWGDAREFVEKLAKRTGRPYRLPTEAEWEYAARSGGRAEQWAGTSDPDRLGDYAWHRGNSGRETHGVGLKLPNGLGLHDMSGNVWEWCQDFYAEGYAGGPGVADPQGPAAGTLRIERGGSWDDEPELLRTSYRHFAAPTWIRDALGFRVALSPEH